MSARAAPREAPTNRNGWPVARNVLCVRLDNMGDVLMSTPAMRALKRQAPGRRLTLLASPSGALLAPHLADVDDVLVHEAAWVKNEGAGNEAGLALIETLRDRRFDAAVIFTVYSQSALPAALLCHLAGIPLVLGHARENPYRLLSTWVPETEPQERVRHEVQRQLDLVASVGARCDDTRLAFATRARDRVRMRAVLRESGVRQDGWIVAHCGATAASRRYGPGLYAEVFRQLRSAGRPIVLTGSRAERSLVDDIIAGCGRPEGLFNLAGRLELGGLGCLIEDADLLVSNNSGPVHIAAAVQTPVVDLYALTNPQHTPWQVPHRLLYHDVPCKYCYRSACPLGHNACLQQVPPAAVSRAALDLLGANHGGALNTAAA